MVPDQLLDTIQCKLSYLDSYPLPKVQSDQLTVNRGLMMLLQIINYDLQAGAHVLSNEFNCEGNRRNNFVGNQTISQYLQQLRLTQSFVGT